MLTHHIRLVQLAEELLLQIVLGVENQVEHDRCLNGWSVSGPAPTRWTTALESPFGTMSMSVRLDSEK